MYAGDDSGRGDRAQKNEVIVQKAHRYEYDHAMQLCNVTIKEVVTADDFRRAISDRTVMTNFFNAAEGGEIGREQWLAIAHERGVPCHLDAAADMPPIENLWKYTGMGFDLVCFSGGKGIRGPQNAGLLLGRKDLIALAYENDNPNSDATGRGMKVAKEQIVGMVAAVDWLLEQTDEHMQAEFMQRTDVIRTAMQGIPSVTTRIVTPEVANHVPHLVIDIDPQRLGVTPLQVADKLRAGKPSIELNPGDGYSGSWIDGDGKLDHSFDLDDAARRRTHRRRQAAWCIDAGRCIDRSVAFEGAVMKMNAINTRRSFLGTMAAMTALGAGAAALPAEPAVMGDAARRRPTTMCTTGCFTFTGRVRTTGILRAIISPLRIPLRSTRSGRWRP